MRFTPGMQRWFIICKLINVIFHTKLMKDNNNSHLNRKQKKKAFEKSSLSFHDKNSLNKLSIDGTYFKIIKVTYNKPT